jgi:hypothetical protein
MPQYTHSPSERTVAAPSRRGGGLSKLECFIRFDEVHFWLSRTRELIANAESYSYPAFRESFRELRREARKSEMELVIALFRFERAMNKAMSEFKS